MSSSRGSYQSQPLRQITRTQTAGNLGETAFDSEVVPSSHSEIAPILRVANEVKSSNLRVAYLSHRLNPTSSGRCVRQFKTALLQRFEIAYDGDDGWIFIEEYSYQLVIDTIIEEQTNTEQEKLEEDCSQKVNGEGTSDSKRPATETSTWTLEPSCSSVNPNTALQISNGLDCASEANEALCSAKLTNESVEAEGNLTRYVQYPWSSSHSTPFSHNPPLPNSNSTKKRRPCYGWICSDDEEDLVELKPGPLAEEIENWLSSFREHKKSGYESGSGTGGCSGLFCWSNSKSRRRAKVKGTHVRPRRTE